MTARTSTTPHRHFSQMTDRSDAPQPAAIATRPSPLGSFDEGTTAPLLAVGEIGLAAWEDCAATGGALGCKNVRVGDRGLVVGPSLGCEGEVGGFPRSF